MKPWFILQDARKKFSCATSETEYRAVASRAYIGTYQHLLAHPKLAAFKPKGIGEDHRSLIDYLKNSSDQMLKRLGVSRLPRLRALRNHADYELGMPFTRGLAEEALEDAEEIVFDWLPVDEQNIAS